MKKDIIQETGADSVFDITPNIGSQTPNEAIEELNNQIDLFEDATNTDSTSDSEEEESEESEVEEGESPEEGEEGEEESESEDVDPDIDVLPLMVNALKSRGFLPS